MLQSLRQAPEHVHGVGEAAVRSEGDGGSFVSCRLPAMRVGIMERDTRRWRRPRREGLLAHRGQSVVLGQPESRHHRYVVWDVWTSVGHV